MLHTTLMNSLIKLLQAKLSPVLKKKKVLLFSQIWFPVFSGLL